MQFQAQDQRMCIFEGHSSMSVGIYPIVGVILVLCELFHSCGGDNLRVSTSIRMVSSQGSTMHEKSHAVLWLPCGSLRERTRGWGGGGGGGGGGGDKEEHLVFHGLQALPLWPYTCFGGEQEHAPCVQPMLAALHPQDGRNNYERHHQTTNAPAVHQDWLYAAQTSGATCTSSGQQLHHNSLAAYHDVRWMGQPQGVHHSG